MDAAEQCAPCLGNGREAGVLLLLEMENRKFLQTLEEPRPTVGAMAAGERTGDRTPPAGGGDGVRGGLAPGGGRFSRGNGAERHADPVERSPDEAKASAYGASPAGGNVGVAVDAGALRSRPLEDAGDSNPLPQQRIGCVDTNARRERGPPTTHPRGIPRPSALLS